MSTWGIYEGVKLLLTATVRLVQNIFDQMYIDGAVRSLKSSKMTHLSLVLVIQVYLSSSIRVCARVMDVWSCCGMVCYWVCVLVIMGWSLLLCIAFIVRSLHLCMLIIAFTVPTPMNHQVSRNHEWM